MDKSQQSDVDSLNPLLGLWQFREYQFAGVTSSTFPEPFVLNPAQVPSMSMKDFLKLPPFTNRLAPKLEFLAPVGTLPKSLTTRLTKGRYRITPTPPARQTVLGWMLNKDSWTPYKNTILLRREGDGMQECEITECDARQLVLTVAGVLYRYDRV